MPDMSCLHVDSVTKSFGLKTILSDIFISCKQGEIVGLLGRNGCGKSTLLKIIFGSLQADNKFIRAGDRRITSLSDTRGRISYLPQNSFLPDNITVKKAISLFCNKTGFEIIAGNELIKPLLDKRTSHLSSAERRLTEIFMIIFSDVDYTLIDEPFNGVAPIYKDEIKKLIKEKSADKGFIITDHDYRNILDVSTRIVLLHEGTTHMINNAEELKLHYLP